MKKMKPGIVEILGYIGLIIWVAVNMLRGYSQSTNPAYLFLLGILPNLGAAWVMTMFAKWGIVLGLKKRYVVKTHMLICLGILLLALLSEIIHAAFLDSPFDIYDMLITVGAQLVILLLPVFTKDKSFGDSYSQA